VSATTAPMEFTVSQIVYQALLFVVLYFALKNLVFDRFLANIDARHRRTRGALEQATKLREEAARLQSEYEVQLAELRREAAAAGEEIRRHAESEERELLESARQEAARSLTEARRRIAAEVETTRAALGAETAKLVEDVVRNILKRPS
jgi:F-type H+-transporting ATPase subunit b